MLAEVISLEANMATALVRDLDDAVYERLKGARRARIERWRPS